MAITENGVIVAHQSWGQGDARDPLGVWGMRHGVTGDASGGGVKVIGSVPAGLAAAYVYTAYSAQIGQLTGAFTTTPAKLRLLTNWPNLSPVPGVQGYASLQVVNIAGDANFTSPLIGPFDGEFIKPNDRFILLYDPRPSAGQLDILEFEFGDNTNLATYSFEAYGYFWDRSVMNAPGGPRFPGSS